jgi:hypothetical protein
MKRILVGWIVAFMLGAPPAWGEPLITPQDINKAEKYFNTLSDTLKQECRKMKDTINGPPTREEQARRMVDDVETEASRLWKDFKFKLSH